MPSVTTKSGGITLSSLFRVSKVGFHLSQSMPRRMPSDTFACFAKRDFGIFRLIRYCRIRSMLTAMLWFI